MQVTSIVIVAVLSLTLPLFTVAEHQGPSRRHSALAERKRADLEKRAFNGQATWYDVGLGACGQYNAPGDFIVALNSAQFAGSGYPGPNCFKPITISAFGKTAQAVIVDECPGCAYGSLDFSVGLFQYFTSLDAGVFQFTWWFNDGSAAPTTTTSTWTAPTTTSVWVDPSPWTSYTTTSTYTPPTSTWTPPTTTSTWSQPTTSTSTSTSSSSQSSSSTLAPNSTTTDSASYTLASTNLTTVSLTPSTTGAPAATGLATVPENIAHVNELVLGLAQFVKN
ncbi:hypothetical protein M422DRAFT_782773 [Sphaerobolus stellatus SS14]|uniref:Expansin-like EG45 domain-containing protein n=1 Tax=Sphaerobolus stellatus (strain SS14) TaxID=990650 RepID=A0A0C9VAU3_SPHS4|nr:hypothetical protein M422DRAFT_782773 [Sphaerobolus stellatus SS14]